MLSSSTIKTLFTSTTVVTNKWKWNKYDTVTLQFHWHPMFCRTTTVSAKGEFGGITAAPRVYVLHLAAYFQFDWVFGLNTHTLAWNTLGSEGLPELYIKKGSKNNACWKKALADLEHIVAWMAVCVQKVRKGQACFKSFNCQIVLTKSWLNEME